ncbi:MAG TPA: autotransporter-associated beta strand repeat-containing protein, partial [Rhizomicrobium sp.]|nr:autotransporter-associated beta strand repeat-containing protein [Rhizomicrobium sp.]
MNWSDAGNWSPGVPAAGDTVIIDQTGTGSNAPSNYDISKTFGSVTFDTGVAITNAASNTFGIASGGFVTDDASSAVTFASNLPVTLNGATTINVNSGSLTFGGGLTGTGPVTVNNSVGTGALIFLGSSDYTGGTTISTGTLQLGNGTTSGNITTAGGTVSIASGANLTFDEPGSVAFNQTISGQGSVTLSAGTVTLSGVNTYSGGTNVAGGELVVGASDNLGTGTIAFTNNGALQITGSDTFAQAVTLGAGGGTIDTDGSTAQFTGGLTGTGALTVNNSGSGGALVLIGTNNYSGGTTINSGATLQVGSDTLQGSISAAGNVALNGGTLDFHNLTSNFFDYGGVISGTGNVSIDQGTVVYTNSNTYAGTTTIGSGATLQIGQGGALGGITQNSVIVDNGTLAFENFGTTATVSGGISGTGALVLNAGSATDTLILTGTNTYASGSATLPDTSITQGILQVGSLATSTTGSIEGNVYASSNGTIDFNNIDPTNNTFSGNIEGQGTLEVDSGTVILTNNTNTIATTDIVGGTLQIGNGLVNGGSAKNVGSLASTAIIDDGTLAFDPPTATTFLITGNISGTGGINQIGPGTTELTGTDSFTGNSTISSGTLEFGTGATFTGGATQTFTVDSGATLAFNTASTFTFSNVITGAGNVSVGNGTVILTNTDDYSGATSIGAGGTLQIGDSTPGAVTGTNAVTIASGGNLDFVNSSASTFSAPISGTGSVTVDLASGSLALSGNNTYSGGTNIEGGTLAVSSHTNLGTGAITFTSATPNNATLQFLGADTFTQGVTLGAGGGTFDTNGNAVAWSGVIQGTGGLTLTDSAGGTGSLTLIGNNTYSGGTTITTTGTLIVGNGTTEGTFSGDVVDNNVLTFNEPNATTVGGNISGSGQVDQNGPGALTLSGTNSYTGGTYVGDDATLAVSSSSNLGAANSFVQLDPGAILKVTETDTFTQQLIIGSHTSAPTIDVVSGQTATWSGLVSKAGSPPDLGFNLTGGGTLVLTNTSNNFGGTTAVYGGSTLSIGSDAVLGSSDLTLGDSTTNTGGTLDVTSSFTLGSSRAVAVAGAGGTIETASGVTFEIAQGIAGTGPLNVAGPGTFVLAGTSSYTGNTNIANSATLQLGDGTNAGTIAGTSVVNDSGTLSFNEAGNASFSNTIQGSGGLTQDDTSATPGTLTLTGADTYTGTTMITSGTLQLGDGTNAGTLTSNISDGTALIFDEPTNTTYGDIISGA